MNAPCTLYAAQQDKIRKLLEVHQGSKKTGCTLDYAGVKLDLIKNAERRFARTYRMPKLYEEEFAKELVELQDKGVVSLGDPHTKRNSKILRVPKKNESGVRLC